MQGKVKFFNAQKGFGFITPEGEGEDLFVHISNIQGQTVLEQDQTVEFEIGEGRRGPMAVEVALVNQ